MKENIKKLVLGSFVFYVVAIAVLILCNYNNAVVEIWLSDSEKNIQTLNDYKKQVQLLEKNDCTVAIGEVIKYYEKTAYGVDVNLKEMYESGNMMSMFNKITKGCNLSSDDFNKFNLPLKTMTDVLFGEQLIQKYMFQYEIGLKDVFSRYIADVSFIDIGYNVRQITLLEIIESLLEIYNERMVEHE